MACAFIRLAELIGFAGGSGLALLHFGIDAVIAEAVSAQHINAYLRPKERSCSA